jgi:hypothetical protein
MRRHRRPRQGGFRTRGAVRAGDQRPQWRQRRF